MSRSRLFKILGLLLALSVFLAACGGGQPAGEPAAPSGENATPAEPEAPKHNPDAELVVGRAGDSVGFDPANTTDSESSVVILQVFETLVQNARNSLEVEPGLAESWEIKDEGKTYIFHLRKGVKFHDGEPFNADAVVFNFDRWMDEENPYRGEGTYFWYKLFFGGFPGIVESVRALDEHTVELKLSKPYAPLLSTISGYGFSIVSPKAIKEHTADLARNPVGTGPYKFVDWVEGDRVVIERFADYWGEPAANARVTFRVMPDAQSRVFSLQAGDINILRGLHPDHIPLVESDPNAQVVLQESLGFAYLGFNTKKAPWDNPLVRRAVAHAINKQSLVETLGGGLATPAKVPYPPAYWGYNADAPDHAYDPDRAKQLLTEAGFPSGFKTTLWAMPISRGYLPEPQKVAEALQADLAAVGIQAEIVTYDWGTYLDKTAAGEQDMFLLGLESLSADPDFHLRFSFDGKGGGRTFYTSERYANLMEQGLLEQDQARRAQIYQQVQEVLLDELPVVSLFHMASPHAAARGLDFQPHPLGMKFRWVTVSH